MCCRGFSEEKGVIIWPSDSIRIAKELKMPEEKFLKTYCYPKDIKLKKGKVIIHLLNYIDETCIFLSNDNLCLIHNFKPIQCVKTPFSFFWDERYIPQYKCMANIDIPSNWGTSVEDKLLIEYLKISQ